MAEKTSLRFPEGKDVSGLFEGNDPSGKSEPLSYLTRQRNHPPIIPQPPQEQLDEAERKSKQGGSDPHTNLPWQPEWVSVLVKRQPPWFWFRWLFFNCFCNPTCTLTRAQWYATPSCLACMHTPRPHTIPHTLGGASLRRIWFANLIAFCVHGYFAYLCLNEGIPKADKMEVTVWRLQTRWDNAGADSYVPTVIGNERPIRIDFVAGGFFGLSALFHAMIVLLGPFDRFVYLLWRQIDLAFMWYRWCVPAHAQRGTPHTKPGAHSLPPFTGSSTPSAPRS